MRNIEFKEDQGPGIWRRVLAFLLIVVALLGAAGYEYFVAHVEYESSMTLLVRDADACDRLLADTLGEKNRDTLLASIGGTSGVVEEGIRDIPADELPDADGDSSSAKEDVAAVPVAGSLQKLVTSLVPARQSCVAALGGVSFQKKGGNELEIRCRECATRFHENELTGGAMLKAILRSMEKSALQMDFERVQREITEINKNRQMLAQESGGLGERFKATPTALLALRELAAAGEGKGWPNGGWQSAFAAEGASGRIVTALERQLGQAQDLTRQIVRDRELSASLEGWINAPENQSVVRRTKRVVYHEDSPELLRLRDQKAQIEASRMRLLQRATSQHPAAVRMSQQIDELQTQIEALTRLPEVVEDVVEETNSEMNNWQKQLADAAAAIRGTEAKLGEVRQNILALSAQLQLAEERARQQKLQNEKLRVQSELKMLVEKNPAAADLPFSVYLPVGLPRVVQRPAAWPIYGGALACALVFSTLLLISRRHTRFGVLEKPEEVLPEYPVLGSIPRFGDEQVRTGERKESA